MLLACNNTLIAREAGGVKVILLPLFCCCSLLLWKLKSSIEPCSHQQNGKLKKKLLRIMTESFSLLGARHCIL